MRDTASTWARVNHTIAIGRLPLRRPPPARATQSPASAPWAEQVVGAQRPVASSSSPTGGCIKCAPVHRPRASSSQLLPSLSVLPWQGEHPRLVVVASSPPLLLKHQASSLAFLCTPRSPSQHPRIVLGAQSPRAASPPLPHLGSSVKAVPQWLPLSVSGSLSSLSLR